MKQYKITLVLFAAWTTIQLHSSERQINTFQPTDSNIYFPNGPYFYNPYAVIPPNHPLYCSTSYFLDNTQQNLNTSTHIQPNNESPSEKKDILEFAHMVTAYQAMLTHQYLLKQIHMKENIWAIECETMLKKNIQSYKESDNPYIKKQLKDLENFEKTGLADLFQQLSTTIKKSQTPISQAKIQFNNATSSQEKIITKTELLNLKPKASTPKITLKKMVETNITNIKNKK